MADKIPWKPDKTPMQSFLANQGTSKNPTESKVISKPHLPEKDIWVQRATWMIIGIFICIAILWLAFNTGSSDRRSPEDFEICDGTRTAYCP